MFGKRAYYAIAMVAVVFSTVGLAQKFQEPSKDELQLAVDPKAPGAPAVFLYREEVTDNFTHYVSVYARIKVLTEAGKEWATVEVPYQPGYQGRPMVEARTIHADGSVYPLSISEADLLEGQHRAIRQHTGIQPAQCHGGKHS
jgi:hypothetical protein